MSQRGIIHLLPLLLIAVVLIGAVLVVSGKLKAPSLFQKKPSVVLQTEYQNPFKQESQYVNPFDQYKNPFAVSK